MKGPTTPQRKSPRFGLFPVRSPLLRKSIFLSSPAVTEMFQFTAFAAIHLWIQCMPVRESRDRHSFDNSPELFAVFHALQSLLTPRHPPRALSSLVHINRTLSNPAWLRLKPGGPECINPVLLRYIGPPDHCAKLVRKPTCRLSGIWAE